MCGDRYRGECAVLVTAVEEGVAGELLSNSSSALPTEVLLGRLSDRLHANRGVSTDLARWGVESWAVALGIAAGGNTLAKFRMDGLVPLIELAGANGTITEAELNHLILEAKTRGVSEADTRAYLSAHAAARGWQLGKAQRRSRAAPQPGSPHRQSQPASPPLVSPQPVPDRAFRWVLAGVVALVAIAVIVVVVNKEPPPSATATVRPPSTAPTPAPAPAPDPAEREQRVYNAAHGNLAALRAYVNSCTVCTYAPAARSEISKLETADQEERTYNAAHGNKYALQAYLNTCTVCAYSGAARGEIASLEAAEPKRVSSSAVICGRSIDYVIDPTGVSNLYRSYLGVWTGAAWNSKICGGLIVHSVANDGTPQVTYIYGPLPGSQFPWKQQSPTASIQYNQLSFQDEERGAFTFRLNGQNVLNGHFVSANGVTLDAVLTRDLSSVPQ